jgi:hypothetical protein
VTVRLTLDPSTLKPGDVVFSVPGFNKRKHKAEARREHVARSRAAGWKWIRLLMSPSMIARLRAMVNEGYSFEGVILEGLRLMLDQRDAKILRREKRDAAKAVAKSGAS